MNILDIDLDFFLQERAIEYDVAEMGERLDDSSYPVWGESDVKWFLEEQCCLSVENRIPMTIVSRHDKVFAHVLRKAFSEINLYHVDAHHDLYPIESPWFYNDYSNKSISERESLPFSICPRTRAPYLSEGNYIGFLLACEKLTSVSYITSLDKRWGDRPSWMFCRNFDDTSGILQVPRINDLTFRYDGMDLPWLPRISSKFEFYGTEVPFHIVDFHVFSAREIQFDHAFLSLSPEYTPKSADRLVPTILQFFELVD